MAIISKGMRIEILVMMICSGVWSQVRAQTFNLVSNGGFELNVRSFVEDTSFINAPSCWIAANKCGFPIYRDELNIIAPEVPRPHSGRNYINLQYLSGSWKVHAKFVFDSSLGVIPYAQTRLLSPLEAGVTYYLSFFVGQTKNSGKLKNIPHVNLMNLGAYFSTSQLSDYSNYKRIDVKPQIEFRNLTIAKYDTFEYVKLTDTFTALGGEQYLTIGNFDYYKDYNLYYYVEGSLIPNSDTLLSMYNFMFIDDISLVRDTSQPMISLDHFSLGPDTSLCPGDSIRLGGDPYFFGYRWNTGDTSRFLTITKPGVYWCSADFGCSRVTDTIVVLGSVAPQAFNLQDTAICEALLPLSFNAPYRGAVYLWSNGSRDFSTRFFSTGKQWLRISNACGDQYATDTFEIQSLNTALDKLDLGKDTSNCMFGYFTDTITLRVPELKGHQINWSNGAHGNVIRIYDTGTYWVEVSNACYAVSDTIRINGCAARDVPKVDIPNAFSPNGDGKNDVFRIRNLPQQVASFTLKIYNRYGQQVAELHNRSDYWDGGNFDIGVYFYLFTYEDVNGKKYSQKGDISLIR